MSFTVSNGPGNALDWVGFYCPDTSKYYPDVNTCASAWLKVVPDGAAAPR
jgi:hypothetical protein